MQCTYQYLLGNIGVPTVSDDFKMHAFGRFPFAAFLPRAALRTYSIARLRSIAYAQFGIYAMCCVETLTGLTV